MGLMVGNDDFTLGFGGLTASIMGLVEATEGLALGFVGLIVRIEDLVAYFTAGLV